MQSPNGLCHAHTFRFRPFLTPYLPFASAALLSYEFFFPRLMLSTFIFRFLACLRSSSHLTGVFPLCSPPDPVTFFCFYGPVLFRPLSAQCFAAPIFLTRPFDSVHNRIFVGSMVPSFSPLPITRPGGSSQLAPSHIFLSVLLIFPVLCTSHSVLIFLFLTKVPSFLLSPATACPFP